VGDIDDNRIAGVDDAEVESAVLRQLLLLHPAQVTVEELTRDVAADPEDFAERDAVERAVRDLARAGLLHRNGEFAIPSRAALRFNELLGG
jgi:predicted transcriptional regulator